MQDKTLLGIPRPESPDAVPVLSPDWLKDVRVAEEKPSTPSALNPFDFVELEQVSGSSDVAELREMNAQPRRMQPATKQTLAFIGACLFGCLVIGIVVLVHRSDSSSDHASRNKLYYGHADLTIDAQSLFSAYVSNLPAADVAYNSKVLEISGTVASVNQDSKGTFLIYSVLRPHPPGPVSLNQMYERIAAASASGVQGVRCYFASKPAVKAGEDVTLRGRCIGMPLDVEIHDCEVMSPSPRSRIK
jgi:hypothetical protein